jgi:hypothetical protein
VENVSIEMPAFGFDEVMVKLRKKAFKLGWKQHESGRLDCIQKDFGNIKVWTLGAGNDLMFSAKDLTNPEGYVPLTCPEIKQAIDELLPIIERLIKRNKKKFKEGFEWANKEGGYHLTPSKWGF